MSLQGLQKSVRMFRKFSEETLRRRGTSALGRDGVVALAAIQAVLEGQRLFDGALLEPLSAFTNLLQSGQLPPEFGDWGLGDALLAIEQAHAQLRQQDAQRWEFSPELSDEQAARVAAWLPARAATTPTESEDHGRKLRRFVLDASERAQDGLVLVCGALHAPELPLAELSANAGKLILNDLDLAALEDLVHRVVPERHRERVQLERYDPSGSLLELMSGVDQALAQADNAQAAEAALKELLASYDVGAGSAGLSGVDGRPDLAISAMLLSQLGDGPQRCLAHALEARGFSTASLERGPLAEALLLLSRLLEQHHVHALTRRAASAVLISAVSEVKLRRLSSGQSAAQGDPRDLLSVEHLAERLPASAEIKAEQSWEWSRPLPAGAKDESLLTLVEAVLV